MGIAIELQSVSKRYQLGTKRALYGTLRDAVVSRRSRRPVEEFWALRDVSFEVAAGDAVGIIGRNGAGKSTTLKIVSRITRPTSGRAVVRGRVGSLLEVGTGFHPELSGRENIWLNAAILGMGRQEIRSKEEQIIAFAEIEEFIDTPVKRYSSGMAMRLAFSVAAHLDPEILLVDEVLAVGDRDFQRKCLGRIGEIEGEGRTIVFVSHTMAAIEAVCTRAVLLVRGQLAADGPVQEVISAYHDPPAETAGADFADHEPGPRFLSWSLDGDGLMGAFTLRSGSRAVFAFRLAIDEPLEDILIGFAIHADDGSLVTSMTSFDITADYLSLDPAVHEIEFGVPTLPLGSGRYHPYVTITDRTGTIDAWNGRPFEVVRRRPSRQVPPPWEGILSLEPTLEVRKVETAQARDVSARVRA